MYEREERLFNIIKNEYGGFKRLLSNIRSFKKRNGS